jgi:hypothetical protein
MNYQKAAGHARRMKVLVGIMHCGENEYGKCIEAVRGQTHECVDVFSVEGLRNREAHWKLYQTFMSRAEEYDLFVKLDADMVLTRRTFLEEAEEWFKANPGVDDLQIAVWDFFTERLIFGLHVYSSRMRWSEPRDNLFVDYVDTIWRRKDDKDLLAPAAYHCPDPSCFQAFHFGLHKAVKVTQYHRQRAEKIGRKVHWENIRRLADVYLRTKEERREYAVIGAWCALRRKLGPEHVDFENTLTNEMFRRLQETGKAKRQRRATCLAAILKTVPGNVGLGLIKWDRDRSLRRMSKFF